MADEETTVDQNNEEKLISTDTETPVRANEGPGPVIVPGGTEIPPDPHTPEETEPAVTEETDEHGEEERDTSDLNNNL